MRDKSDHDAPGPSPEATALPRDRSLVRFAEDPAPASRGRPAQAGFLAQLIACRFRVGPYRDRRREHPETALTRYRRDPQTAPAEFDVVV